MIESFVDHDGYWHASDERQSISLTSIHVSDHRGRPVPPTAILDQMSPIDGESTPVPKGLLGWAVLVPIADSLRASNAITGIVVAESNALIVTVTSEDVAWARSIWGSIRHHPAEARVSRSVPHRPHG